MTTGRRIIKSDKEKEEIALAAVARMLGVTTEQISKKLEWAQRVQEIKAVENFQEAREMCSKYTNDVLSSVAQEHCAEITCSEAEIQLVHRDAHSGSRAAAICVGKLYELQFQKA